MDDVTHELPNAGDLAMVIRVCPCGGDDYALGLPVRVRSLDVVESFCPYCRREYSGEVARIEGDEPNAVFVRAWLRRIKPLSELTTIERREDVPA